MKQSEATRAGLVPDVVDGAAVAASFDSDVTRKRKRGSDYDFCSDEQTQSHRWHAPERARQRLSRGDVNASFPLACDLSMSRPGAVYCDMLSDAQLDGRAVGAILSGDGTGLLYQSRIGTTTCSTR